MQYTELSHAERAKLATQKLLKQKTVGIPICIFY